MSMPPPLEGFYLYRFPHTEILALSVCCHMCRCLNDLKEIIVRTKEILNMLHVQIILHNLKFGKHMQIPWKVKNQSLLLWGYPGQRRRLMINTIFLEGQDSKRPSLLRCYVIQAVCTPEPLVQALMVVYRKNGFSKRMHHCCRTMSVKREPLSLRNGPIFSCSACYHPTVAVIRLNFINLGNLSNRI